MTIQHEKTETKGRFYVEVDGKTEAEMTYSNAGNDKFIIDHTEVNDSLRGKNVGYQLVNAAVKYARVNNLKIIPLCPFANAIFKKNSDLQDVLS